MNDDWVYQPISLYTLKLVHLLGIALILNKVIIVVVFVCYLGKNIFPNTSTIHHPRMEYSLEMI